jgi:hypothetical protein
MMGMTKRGLSIVPPHCRSRWKVLPWLLVNLNHLSRPDVSCLVPATFRSPGRYSERRSSDFVVQVEEGGIELWRPAPIRDDLDAEVAIAIHIERLDGLFEPGCGNRPKDSFDCHQFVPVRASRDRFRSRVGQTRRPDGKSANIRLTALACQPKGTNDVRDTRAADGSGRA